MLCGSQYRRTAHYHVTHRRRQNFYALPTAQWQMLSAPPFNLFSNLEHVDDAIDANGDLADEILNSALKSLGLEGLEADPNYLLMDWRDTAESHHIDKARSTIRQLYRDWSAEGLAERQVCYGPVLEDLKQEFAHLPDKSSVIVLVPGAGLGRLVFEIWRNGHTVEGNEISWHQLIASNWLFNHTKGTSFDLYPFAAEFSNVIRRDHQLKVVKVPDVHVSSMLEDSSDPSSTGRVDLRAGDFISVYKNEQYRERFEAVVTVFFIDTAPNVIRYIETVRHCLRPGGVWINMGPLLWHFEDRRSPAINERTQTGESLDAQAGIQEPGSFELTDEEVVELVRQMGFDVESHEVSLEGVGYINNPESMLQNTYRPSHWVARRRDKAGPSPS